MDTASHAPHEPEVETITIAPEDVLEAGAAGDPSSVTGGGAQTTRRARLDVVRPGGTGAQGEKQRATSADRYKKILSQAWYDVHALLAGFVAPELEWTRAECDLFGELAYDVCRKRNLLRYLESVPEARLIILILRVELVHIKQMNDRLAEEAERGSRTAPARPAVVPATGTGTGAGRPGPMAARPAPPGAPPGRPGGAMGNGQQPGASIGPDGIIRRPGTAQ